MPLCKKTSYYLKRIQQLGVDGLYQTVHKRMRKKIFAHAYKQKALKQQAASSWDQIAIQYQLNLSFPLFFKQLTHPSIFDEILSEPLFNKLIPDDYKTPARIRSMADNAVALRFDLLGSGSTTFAPNALAWHLDFKQKPGTQHPFTTEAFYQDITLPQPTTNPDAYTPDIKVPWELSRLQYLFILGKAYQQALDNNELQEAQQYIDAFHAKVDDWLSHNPFLLGVNWLCPMDVAIRAINLLWGFHFFKHDQNISENFWQKVIESLYDHARYLACNWEWSDKPNNHYLADLLGYLYLCCFFHQIPYFAQQKIWCIKTLLSQFDKQIQPDGTSYEGSTSYHKLVTEMYLHFILICQAERIILPAWVEPQFNKMLNFLSDCSDDQGTLIQIGDNDSGKIVTGIKIDVVRDARLKDVRLEPHIKTYPYFGLTIIKQSGWQITFRHPTFSTAQPSGHFHQDQLAITLSIDGHQILVDPGSYLYTANKFWRNQMRSWQSHNNFYLIDQPYNLDTYDLFQLPRTQQLTPPIITHDDSLISIHDEHHEYAPQEITAHRTLLFDYHKKSLTMQDWYTQQTITNMKSCWTLIFHPDIQLRQTQKTEWIIAKKEQPIARLTSSLDWRLGKGIHSPCYGVGLTTKKLCVTQEVLSNQKIVIIIAPYIL